MEDCISSLFELCHRHHPYEPESFTERAEKQRMDDTLQALNAAMPDLRHQLFELTDAADILSCYRAIHAFRLGLGLGLTIARETKDI